MKELIGALAVTLAFVSYAPYFRDILKGKTKPHVYSWFIWGFLSLIVFALQIADGAGIGAYVTLSGAAIALLVFALGIREGKKNITTSDTIFFVGSLVATGIWVFAKQPVVSVTLLVIIEMLGFAPTLRKAWNKPHEETLSTWVMNAARYTMALFALQSYTYITLVYPISWAGANLAFSLTLAGRRTARGQH